MPGIQMGCQVQPLVDRWPSLKCLPIVLQLIPSQKLLLQRRGRVRADAPLLALQLLFHRQKPQ